MSSNVKRFLGHIGVTLLSFGIVGIYALLALNLKVFSPIAKAIDDYSFEDFYYHILNATEDQDTSNVVTIVDMTELISRRDLANLMTEVAAMNPKVMGVDIVFEGLKEDTLGDQMLLDAVRDCPSAVYAYKLIDRTDEDVHSFFMPTDTLKEGFVNMPRNLYGGLKRSVSIGRMHQKKLYPSFMKQVADLYAGEEVVELADKDLRINFSPIKFHVIPFNAVNENPSLIEDRIVLLGAMKEETDMHYTPLGKMAGTELLAYATETLLKQNKVIIPPFWITCLVTFVITRLTVIIRASYIDFAKRRHPLLRAVMLTELAIGLLVFLIVAVTVWIAFILFCKYNISINLGYAIAAMAFLFTATNLYETIVEQFTKKKKS